MRPSILSESTPIWHSLDGAQVFAVHDVGAVLVFHDRHELAGAAFFFEQIDLVGSRVPLPAAAGGKGGFGLGLGLAKIEVGPHARQRNRLARDRVQLRGLGAVLPAAGVGAGALVGVAAVEVAAQQAAARVGDAQRTVHEHLELDFGALVADGIDFV